MPVVSSRLTCSIRIITQTLNQELHGRNIPGISSATLPFEKVSSLPLPCVATGMRSPADGMLAILKAHTVEAVRQTTRTGQAVRLTLLSR